MEIVFENHPAMVVKDNGVYSAYIYQHCIFSGTYEDCLHSLNPNTGKPLSYIYFRGPGEPYSKVYKTRDISIPNVTWDASLRGYKVTCHTTRWYEIDNKFMFRYFVKIQKATGYSSELAQKFTGVQFQEGFSGVIEFSNNNELYLAEIKSGLLVNLRYSDYTNRQEWRKYEDTRQA